MLNDHLQTIKEYWNILGSSAPEGCKDHWVDESGNPLSDILFEEVGGYLVGQLLSKGEDLAGKRILEIGCGTGKILRELNKRIPEADLYGIDISEEQIKIAKAQCPKISLQVGEIGDLVGVGQGREQFDLIFLHSVTQYFPSADYLQEFLSSCCAILTKGGSLYLLDTPITWYYEQMRGVPKYTLLDQVMMPIKQCVKKIIGYKSKAYKAPLTAKITMGGREIVVPTFSGYWADPDLINRFGKLNFEESRMEYSLLESKPLIHRKYRPNFIMSGKR